MNEHLLHADEKKYEKKSYAEDKAVIFDRFLDCLAGKSLEELQKERQILINRLNELKPELDELLGKISKDTSKNDKFLITQTTDIIADLMSKLAIVTTYIKNFEKVEN
jgi:hypothetical protein